MKITKKEPKKLILITHEPAQFLPLYTAISLEQYYDWWDSKRREVIDHFQFTQKDVFFKK